MAFDHHAVEPQEHRAVVIVGIKMMLEQLGRGAGNQEAEFGAQRAGKAATQQIGYEPRGPLDRFQCDIAGKAIGHHHVHVAAVDLVRFNKAVELQRQPLIRLELRSGIAQHFGALAFFGADVEQPHAGPFAPGDDPRIGRAHDGELHQIARVTFGIRAQIEHHHVIVAKGGHQGRERRTINPRHSPQRQLGHRHQRPGIARADRSTGIAAFDRVDCQPHRCGLGPAQRLGGLFIPADNIRGMEHFGSGAQVGVVVQRRLDSRFIANQQKLEAIMAAPGNRRTFHHHAHAFIAAHRINSDTRQTHQRVLK